MKQRVADFVANYLADNGINQVFSVVGGMAMHLNNALGTNKKLNVMYNHHEQACAIAAESYSRVHNKMAAVCVTAGPGGTNAITGVLCAFLDSLPMIVISGQVRSDITVAHSGLDLRQFGEQEYQIVKSMAPMTKYAVMVTDAQMIKYHLGKALHLAQSGRRGPVWIDLPLDIQGQIIEINGLKEYTPFENPNWNESNTNKIFEELSKARKPVIIAGSSVRTTGAYDMLHLLAQKLRIPVICPTSTVDVMANDDEFYYGMFGSFGGRVGNFIVQEADLILSFGCRFSFKQIGFNYKMFSPNSKKIAIDIDAEEFKKPTVHIDMPIHANLYDAISSLNKAQHNVDYDNKVEWLKYCQFLKEKLNVPTEYNNKSISAYQFSDEYYKTAPSNAITVLGNNCAAISFLQKGTRQNGQRIYGNVNCGPMGYDIPAAIGAAIASKDTVFCMTGDGTFQMNLQELQTIVHHKLPVKMVVFNNNSYQAIVQTQNNFFDGVHTGCTIDSGISFPSFEKIAYVYDLPFYRITESEEISDALKWLYDQPGYALLEVVQTETDPIQPKMSSKKLDDGTVVSLPIDNLFPFLSDEEYNNCKFANFQGGKEK